MRWRPGRRAVLFVNNDGAYPLAPALVRAGIAVAAIVDPRPEPGDAARRLADGIPLYSGHAGDRNRGARRRCAGYGLRPAEASGRQRGRAVALDCDLLAVSGGWNPNVQLFAQARGRLRFDPDLAALTPDDTDAAVECAGAANGNFVLAACLAEGEAAGLRAAALCGFGTSRGEAGSGVAGRATRIRPRPRRRSRARCPPREARRAFVDLHNDVTAADIALAAREGYAVPEHLKRYTTLGMGTDQGKTGNLAGLALLAAATGQSLAATGPDDLPPALCAGRPTASWPDASAVVSPTRCG